MILTDPFVVRLWHPGDAVRWTLEAALVIAVIVVGRMLSRSGSQSEPRP
jgi:hypothetical protein